MLTRRGLLALPALAALPARGQSFPDVLLVVLADLHSAYGRAAQVIAHLDRVIEADPIGPRVILINGDVFERGNAICLRSLGTADWAFLSALRQRGPVVLNLGNHEGALVDDMRLTVAALRARGIHVLSNLRDRSGLPIADSFMDLRLNRRLTLRIVGIATDEANTYRAPVRAGLSFPDPAAWARANLPDLLHDAEFPIVLSHAGVVADRAMLPLLPPGTLLVGGHEHLRFAHASGPSRYVHTGSWNRFMAIVGLNIGAPPAITVMPVQQDDPTDRELAGVIADVIAGFTEDADRAVLGRLPAAKDLGEAGRFLAAAMAEAAGAEIGLISHTTLGDGLPAGPVDRLAMDAFIRFDGTLERARVDGRTLAAILARANQDGDIPLEARTGDFLYANATPVLEPDRQYDVATIGWVRMNAARYLGTTALSFEERPDLRLKAVAAGALER